MARRKRRSGGLGAVAKHGSQFSKKNRQRTFRVCVTVARNIGASTKHQYNATAGLCTGKKWVTRGRLGLAAGSTPTSASKKALRDFTRALK